MKVLYVGPLNKTETCYQRMQALIHIGCDVTPLDTETSYTEHIEKQLFYRIKRKILGPSDLAGINEKIMSFAKEYFYHILWIDKGLTVNEKTLKQVKQSSPKTLIVGYSPDDALNPDNQSGCFLKSLSFYDIFVTTKSYNVTELKKLGCQRAVFVNNAFDPWTHRPVNVSAQDRLRFGGKVGFIGTWEKQRAGSLRYLAANSIPIRIWGEGWAGKLKPSKNLVIENRPLLGVEYAKAICSFAINICFLRKANRDLQTTRSVEIPACGGFMLAERTHEHELLFKAGLEAEYFGSNKELLRKIRHYLVHDKERKAIAQAGCRRCLIGGYSNLDRLKEVFRYINDEFGYKLN